MEMNFFESFATFGSIAAMNDLTRGLCQKWIDEYGKEIIGNIYDNPEILNK